METESHPPGLELESLTGQIIGAAIEVHREVGPGALESTYESCLCFELADRRVSFVRQIELPVIYKGRRIDCGYRLDLLVDDNVIIELKAIERLMPIHEAQLITYLRLGNFPVGLLINFNVPRLMDGLIRRANTRPSPRSQRPPR